MLRADAPAFIPSAIRKEADTSTNTDDIVVKAKSRRNRVRRISKKQKQQRQKCKSNKQNAHSSSSSPTDNNAAANFNSNQNTKANQKKIRKSRKNRLSKVKENISSTNDVKKEEKKGEWVRALLAVSGSDYTNSDQVDSDQADSSNESKIKLEPLQSSKMIQTSVDSSNIEGNDQLFLESNNNNNFQLSASAVLDQQHGRGGRKGVDAKKLNLKKLRELWQSTNIVYCNNNIEQIHTLQDYDSNNNSEQLYSAGIYNKSGSVNDYDTYEYEEENSLFDVSNSDDSSSCCSDDSSFNKHLLNIQSYIDEAHPVHAAICKDDLDGLSSMLALQIIAGAKVTNRSIMTRLAPVDELPLKKDDNKCLLLDVNRVSVLHLCIYLDRFHHIHRMFHHEKVMMNKNIPSSLSVVDIVDEQFRSPLMLSCILKRESLLQILLEHGANPNMKDNLFKNTSIHWCCQYGNPSMLRFLLLQCGKGNTHYQRALCNGNKENQTPVHLACASGNIDIVDSLLLQWPAASSRAFTSLDKHGDTPIVKAVKNNHIEMTNRLLMYKGNRHENILENITASGKGFVFEPSYVSKKSRRSCPLLVAVKNEATEIVDLLLGCVDDASNLFQLNESLGLAVLCKDEKIRNRMISFLIAAGAEPHESFLDIGCSPISYLAREGHVSSLSLIMKSYLRARTARRAKRSKVCKLRAEHTTYFEKKDSAEDSLYRMDLQDALLRALADGIINCFFDEKALLCSSLILEKGGIKLIDFDGFLRLLRVIYAKRAHFQRVSVADIEKISPSINDNYQCSVRRRCNDNNVVTALPNWIISSENDEVYCPYLKSVKNIFVEEKKYRPSHADEIYLLIENKRYMASKEALSKCLKFAAAIRYASFNQQNKKGDQPFTVEIDLPMKFARFVIQHCYLGSIVSGLPVMKDDCCRTLLDLAIIADEYSCISLLLECEMRLLAKNPCRCFCSKCCGRRLTYPYNNAENTNNDVEYSTFNVFGPSLLITPSVVIDVIAISRELMLSHLNYEPDSDVASDGRISKVLDLANIVYDDHRSPRRPSEYKMPSQLKCNTTHLRGDLISCSTPRIASPCAFYFVRLQAFFVLLSEFKQVLESRSFKEFFVDEYSNEKNFNRAGPILLQTCIDEIAATL